MKLLNLGCGNYIHPQWVNIDFYKTAKEVIPHNLLKGIPFSDSSFDVVYHSHLLEHFTKQKGKEFIKECYRVLKPEGIIRIVVPDLETIAKEYLKNLNRAKNNESLAEFDYEWIVLELIDQMARTYPGGEMNNYLKQKKIPNETYIWERIGYESRSITEQSAWDSKRIFTILKKIKTTPTYFIKQFCLRGLGKVSPVIRIGNYRLSGEVHQWMYDQYSLSKLLKETGFREIELKDALTSTISDWGKYELDSVNGQIRKPDSLFIEARK